LIYERVDSDLAGDGTRLAGGKTWTTLAWRASWLATAVDVEFDGVEAGAGGDVEGLGAGGAEGAVGGAFGDVDDAEGFSFFVEDGDAFGFGCVGMGELTVAGKDEHFGQAFTLKRLCLSKRFRHKVVECKVWEKNSRCA
jgi:hypothetical protein